MATDSGMVVLSNQLGLNPKKEIEAGFARRPPAGGAEWINLDNKIAITLEKTSMAGLPAHRARVAGVDDEYNTREGIKRRGDPKVKESYEVQLLSARLGTGMSISVSLGRISQPTASGPDICLEVNMGNSLTQ